MIASAPAAPCTARGGPRRVLTVSADMGGGHNATASALEAEVRELWAGSEVRRVDTLDVLGPGIGPLFRAIYVSNVESTPWLYEFFYASLWRHRWFANASKRFTGSWAGRRLARQIDRFDPDLVLSTYPLGSAGLAWLRRHRGLRVPTAAYISDFAPHPFWVHADLDANFVMHEVAVPTARAADPRALVRVSAPPVVRDFAPGDRADARRELGLEQDTFVVLVSCGAYAFGDVRRTVDALLDASPTVHVVAACGRDEATRATLAALGHPPTRLTALGWTDRMASYVQAADLVVSNAGGASALESITAGRAVLMARPIAAHGTANADLMVVAGLAQYCATEVELAAYVRAAVADRSELQRLEGRARTHVTTHDLRTGLSRLATPRGRRAPRPRRAWPMRPADAFFSHVETPELLQETGTVLDLDDVSPGQPLTLDALRAEMAARQAGLPPMRRRLVRGRRPGWFVEDEVDVARSIDEVLLDGREPGQTIDSVVDGVWSRPLPEGGPAWAMTLIRDRAAGRTALAIKLHHCAGDGISALGLLDRLLTPVDGDALAERGRAVSRQAGAPTAARLARDAARQAGAVGAGVWSLATRGRPARAALNRPVSGAARVLVRVPLLGDEFRGVARARGVHAYELTLALVADAFGRLLPAAGLAAADEPLRAMFPIAMRPPVLDRVFGNWTGSVALDLPIAAMAASDRLHAVRHELRRRVARGEPQGGSAVMQAAGYLPTALHGRLARLVYNRCFFNTIVSYMSGARGPRWCAGAPVRAYYPVVPLADRVPLTAGLVLGSGTAGIGVLMDPVLGLERDHVAAAVQEAYATLRSGSG